MSLFGDLKYGPGLPAFRLRQPGRAEGRHDAPLRDRHLRHPQPLCRQRRSGGGGRPDLRYLGGGLRGRAQQRIRPRRRKDRARPRQAFGALHLAQGGALSRRNPDDARGRHLDVRDIAHQGGSLLPLLLRRRHQGRERGRARRPVLVQIGGEPRIAADPRADAGTVEGVLGRARFREDDARPAARQRPLQDRIGRPRDARSPIAGLPITGRPICRS